MYRGEALVKKMLFLMMLILPFVCLADNKYYQTFFIIVNLLILIITISIVTINMATYKIVKTSFFDMLLIPMIFNFFIYLFQLFNTVSSIVSTYGLMFYLCLAIINKMIIIFAFIFACRYVDYKLNIKRTYTGFLLVYTFFIIALHYNPIIISMFKYKSIFELIQAALDMTAMTICYIKWKNTDRMILKMMIWALLFLTLSHVSLFFNNLYILKLGTLFKLYFYLIFYHGLFINNLKEPIRFLFKELNIKNQDIKDKISILEEDKKRIELLKKEAIESRNMYQELVNNLPEAIMLKKFDKIVFVNKEAEKMLKTKKENLLNKNVLDIIHEDSREIVKDSQYYKKTSIPIFEEKLIDSDGNIIDVELCVMPIKFYNESYSLSIIKNIKDRKNLIEREKQIRKIKENENFKDNFISNISHEFNTPVNVIYTAVQLLEGKAQQDSCKKYLSIIKKNCERIIRLNNNLIDITKYEAGELKPHFKNENIYEIFENLVNDIKDYLKAKGISIKFTSDSEDIRIYCDKNMIERIALNIISNSIKFSKENGEINIIIKKQRNGVRINIIDDGIGISKENLKNIFQIFNKEDLGLNRRNEGIGIGLSIVKAFIDVHGGKILLRSKKDIGTILNIFIPNNIGLQEAAADICNISEGTDNKINIELSDIY